MRQQGNPNKRLRGRPRKGPNPLTRTYESNGPDVKVRGTALHIAEKYVQLARDAQSSGDTVMAENYFQHAEHYYRIVAASQAQSPQPFAFTRDDDARGDEDEDDLVMDRAPRAPAFVPIDAPQPYLERAPEAGNGSANHRSVAGERRERRSRQNRSERGPRPEFAPEPQPIEASDEVPVEEPVFVTVSNDIDADIPAEEPVAVVDLEEESPRPRRRARGGRGRGRRSEGTLAMADAGGGEMAPAPAEAGPPGDA